MVLQLVPLLTSAVQAVISDTVGFIQKLPPQLVAAFQATLDDIKSASLILHVVDCSHPLAAAQSDAVIKVWIITCISLYVCCNGTLASYILVVVQLKRSMWSVQVLQEIGATDIPMLTIWNKIDLVPNRDLVRMLCHLIYL
jgi:GTP-binding protein HflX